MRISDWSSDVCSSDLPALLDRRARRTAAVVAPAGLAPNIAELVLPRRRPHILRNTEPCMHRRPTYLEADQMYDDAIAHRPVVPSPAEDSPHTVTPEEEASQIDDTNTRVPAQREETERGGV